MKSFNYLLQCLFGILAYFAIGIVARVARESIVHGYKSVGNQFPYHVSLQIHNENVCGGAIIADDYILSAAHCFMKEGEFDSRVTVVAGTDNLNKNGMTVQIKKVFMPKEYRPPTITSTGDISVLKLKNSLKLWMHKNLQRVKLPKAEYEVIPGKTAKISGFGWNWIRVDDHDNDGGNIDGHLRYADADILNLSQCQRDLPNIRITERHICARVRQRDQANPSGACNGDSGGPLVDDRGVIIGTLSTGPDDCLEDMLFGIYTRVSHYVTFIENAMAGREVKSFMRSFNMN